MTIELAPFSVFVGSNNGGKSSIIQALHFLISILQSSHLVRSWAKVNTSSISPDQIIYSPSRDPYALATGGRLVESKKADSDIYIEIQLSGGEQIGAHIRKGKNNNIGIDVDNQDVAVRLASLASPFTIFSPGLAGLAKTEALQSDGMLLRALARGDANVILRNILYRLWKKPIERSAFLDDIRLLFPNFDLKVDFNEAIDEFINVYVTSGDGTTLIPIELAGTGLLQATQILAYIHLYSPNLIVLDEPDSHLHPNNQRVICALLSEMVSVRGIQVLMTSHSRHVLEATVDDAKVFWVQKGQVREARPQDSVDVLLDMGALDVEEAIEAAKPDILVVTEDKLIAPLATLVQANNAKNKNVALKSYFGVRAVDNTKSLIQAVREFSKAKIVVHRDRDYLTPEEVEDWKKSIRAVGAVPFVTQGTDVESYFCRLEHLKEVNPDWSEEELEALRERALNQRRGSMQERAVNWKVTHQRKMTNSDVNVGKIAGAVHKLFEGEPETWVHGKELLAGIRQAAEGQPDKLVTVVVSSKLEDVELRNAIAAV